MKLFTNKITKTVSIVLSACLVCGIAGGVALSAGGEIEKTCGDALKAANEANAAADNAVRTLGGDSAQNPVHKNETVYVMANAQGGVQKVIVSSELKNSSGAKELVDKSCLKDIKNVKGMENYNKNSDGTITWDAGGNDIYYQGTTDKTLPVKVSVRYMLDGREISADEIAGKSGDVTIRFDYSVDKSMVSGSEDTAVPFLAMTGMVLDNDIFSDIEASNGKIINDGDRNVVIGFALPGIRETLDLSKDKEADIPDYFEVKARAENFALESTMTFASCDFVNEVDTAKIESADDLTDALDKVSSSVTQLLDGSSALYDGLSTLLEKSGEMTSGIETLYSGATELSTGLSTLNSNSASLKSGAYQVFSTLTSTAQTQLNAALTENGYNAVTLTPENYASVLGGLLDSFSGGAYTQAKAAVEAKVRPAVEAAVREQVTAGVKETVKASMIEKGYTAEQAEMYLQGSEGAALVNQYTAEKMVSDEIKGTIESNIEKKLASDEIQSQITAAVSNGLEGNASYAAIKSLKASLDNYAAFYSGLNAYTSGVSSAAAGAAKVSGGIGQLKAGGTNLVSGVTQLRDGAMKLSNGMREFSNQLSSKLDNLSDSELSELIPKIGSMIDAAKSYNNYSGIADGAEGSVKFIIKTASIGD